LAAELSFGAALRKDLPDVSEELLDEFSNHFTRHPKTAGRTKTGGPVFFLKKSFRTKNDPPTRLQSLFIIHRKPRRKGVVQNRANQSI
jgi:hypothetical protein